MDYKDKLRLAKEALDSGSYDKETIEYIFPELKESEDERIRKHLVNCLKFSLEGAEDQDAAGCSRQKDIEAYKWGLAWLEKQGEQEPVGLFEIKCGNWYMCLDTILFSDGGTMFKSGKIYYAQNDWRLSINPKDSRDIRKVSNIKDYKLVFRPATKEEIDNYLGFKPKPAEWSEEDEEKLIMCCKFLRDASVCIDYDVPHKEDIEKCFQWLKSLRPQNHWKPSEEQLNALYDVLNPADEVDKNQLESLYNDLKKLKE